MASILVVGNATLDIINHVETYPQEDQEVRASAQQLRRGGNAANTLVVLSQLGHQCAWGGTLADDANAGIIRNDLQGFNINLDAVTCIKGSATPTSYISLSRANGSRTIVHYRDLAEYSLEKFRSIDLSEFDWLHFEGRNLPDLEEMIRHSRTTIPELTISLEVEKPRQGIATFFPLVDVLLFSQDYAETQGAESGEEFLQRLAANNPNALITCTWGEHGAYAMQGGSGIVHAAADKLKHVVDTLGAGDTFNAAMIDQCVRGVTLREALKAATTLAGKKCAQYGLENLPV